MQKLRRLKLGAVSGLIAVLLLGATPKAVQANNTRTLWRDQQAIGQLVQEGILKPNDAEVLGRKAYYLARGSLLHNNPLSNFITADREIDVISPPPTPSGAKQVSRQIHTLAKDHVLSHKQEAWLRMEIYAGMNAVNNRSRINLVR